MTSAEFASGGGSKRAAQARERSPSPARATQRACLRARAEAASSSSRGSLRRRAGAACQSSSRSPSSHLEQQRWVKRAAWSRRRAPPRGAGWRTAFGSMRSSRQARRELVAQSPGQTLGPHAPGGFGHMAQDRDVSRENGGKVRQGITAIGRGKGCSRRRQHSLPSSRPATAMSAIVACRNKHPANGAMVQAMCAAITTGHSASQGPCSMSIQVRAHGGMRLPAASIGGIARWAAGHRAENKAGAVSAGGRPLPRRRIRTRVERFPNSLAAVRPASPAARLATPCATLFVKQPPGGPTPGDAGRGLKSSQGVPHGCWANGCVVEDGRQGSPLMPVQSVQGRSGLRQGWDE